MIKNRMMKILITSITVFILSFIATGNFSVKAAEISGTCGESVTYVLSDDGELLTISGTGDMYDLQAPDMDPDFVNSNFPEKIAGVKKVVITEGVTSIGDYIFEGCVSLELIELPSTLNSIGHCSFRGCISLKGIELPGSIDFIGDNAFSNCESLANFDFPANIDTVPEFCFVGCKNLSSITLHEGLKMIKKQAFGDCPLLTTIQLPKTVTQIDAYAFEGDTSLTSINLPEGITEISENLFDACESLENIELPSTIKVIRERAFYNCTSLKNIKIPEGLTSIGDYAFAVDEYKIGKGVPLTSITLPSTLKSIGSYAFYECHNLTEVEIPEGCLSIGDYAFYGMGGMKLTKIVIPESTAYFGETDHESHVFSPSTISRLTMYGKTGSIAEAYATKCGIAFISNGTATGEVSIYKNGSCGANVSWTLYYDGTLKISGTGEMSDYDYINNIKVPEMSPWYEERDRIERIVVENGITKIGNYAFEECDNLESVQLPESLTELGDDVFFRCNYLENIEIPSTVTIFGTGVLRQCKGLKKVTLMSGIKTIGIQMFEGCSNLNSITIPDSVTQIGEGAFSHCENLTSIRIPDGVTVLDTETFYWCISLSEIELPDGITAIGRDCFANCTFTSFSIPANVKTIGGSAFYGCENLTNISIVENVTEIGDSAFAKTGLTSITIPANVSVLGQYVFNDCTKLETVSFERTAAFASAGSHTFEDCSGLKSVSFAGNCFGEEFIPWMFKNCTSLVSMVIPEGVKNIGSEAFYGCRKLKYVTLPQTVTSISADSFENCTSLAYMNLPNSLIGLGGFVNCSNLTTVVLPTNSNIISTFQNCGGLTRVVLPKADYRIGEESSVWFNLNGCENVTLYAVEGSGVQEFANSYGHTYISIVAVGSCGVDSMAYLAQDGTLFIAGSGAVTELPASIENRNAISKVFVSSGITEIASDAMSGMINVTEIELPVSISNIAPNAFDGCNPSVCIKADPGCYSYNWAVEQGFGMASNHDYHLSETQYDLNRFESLELRLMDGDQVATGVTWELEEIENGGYSVAEDYITLQTDEGSGICVVYGKRWIPSYLTVIAHVGNQSFTCDVKVSNPYEIKSFELDKNEINLAAIGDTGDASIIIVPNTQPPSGVVLGYEEGYDYWETNYNVYEGEEVVEVTKDADNPLLFHIKGLKEGVAKVTLGTGVKGASSKHPYARYSETVTVTVGSSSLLHVHTFDLTKWEYDETAHWRKATCTHTTERGDYAEHTWVEIIDKNATETTEGSKHAECTVCGYKGASVVIPAGQKHIHTEMIDKSIPAGCLTSGKTEGKHCSECGEIIVAQKNVLPLGHKWDNGTVTKQPTVTAEGVKTFKCTNTGCNETKTESIAKLPEPKKNEVIEDKTGNDYKVTDPAKKEVTYKAPANKKAKTVTIPASVEINGVTYKVTKIDDKAFKGNTTVTKVVIPSSVTVIGAENFSGCKNLTTVSVPKNVTTIGKNAFKGCAKLTKVTLPSKCTKIGAGAFDGCKKMKTITIKSTKLTSKSVSAKAFKGLSKNVTIKVPKKQLKAYKKLLKKKGFKGKVK